MNTFATRLIARSDAGSHRLVRQITRPTFSACEGISTYDPALRGDRKGSSRNLD
jgi:hypothetical protein